MCIAYCSPKFPHGTVLLWFHRLFDLGQQLISTPTIEACSCSRSHQRIFPARQRCRVVRLAICLGTVVQKLVRDLHCNQRSVHYYVLYL
jgi:hypothetical protein